jgi:hypothetical protein
MTGQETVRTVGVGVLLAGLCVVGVFPRLLLDLLPSATKKEVLPDALASAPTERVHRPGVVVAVGRPTAEPGEQGDGQPDTQRDEPERGTGRSIRLPPGKLEAGQPLTDSPRAASAGAQAPPLPAREDLDPLVPLPEYLPGLTPPLGPDGQPLPLPPPPDPDELPPLPPLPVEDTN